MTSNSLTTEALSELAAQASGYHNSGQLVQAATLYQCYLRARTERAEFARAPRFSELDINIINRLADVLYQAGKPRIAAEVLEWALELVPDNVQCLNNLAIMWHEMQHYDDAIKAFKKALSIQPEYVDAWLNLAQSLEQQNLHNEALSALEKILQLDAANEYALEARAMLFYKAGDHESASAAFQQWLNIVPSHPVAAHMLAACSGDSNMLRASDAYIRTHFNEFARNYDRQLRLINYRGPDLMQRGLAQLHVQTGNTLTVLDGGCGTGLAAPILRPYARHLCGVDLSSAMLQKARATSCYDELVEADLHQFLMHKNASFDLLVFSDSLPYCGELTALASAAASALCNDGYLLCTAEALADEQNGRYRLHQSGRFQHDGSYLREVLSTASLHPVFCEKVVLREEFGRPVDGYLVAARK